MVAAIESAFNEERFDLVQLENTHMAHYLSTVQKHGAPTVLRLQNVESLVAERHARTVSPPLSWIMLDQARRWRGFEARACEQASLCLAITPEDAERIQRLAPEAQVSVSPAGVDLERYYPKLMTEEPDTVVFIGALDWPPNVDGARWFRSEIWPLIRKADPEARWIVVGKGAPADILAWPESDRSIQVTGFVEDVRPYLHSGALVVVPVRSGGGMRLKILEAMAAGKTVLTTPVGAEGIDARNGEEIFLAPANKTFAETALRILRDEALRKRTGKAAAAWVARFGWDKIAASLENEYHALLNSRVR
jgi:glycosyltransferase involved in cell wall biosynthesis